MPDDGGDPIAATGSTWSAATEPWIFQKAAAAPPAAAVVFVANLAATIVTLSCADKKGIVGAGFVFPIRTGWGERRGGLRPLIVI
jgi:hypothetical protein